MRSAEKPPSTPRTRGEPSPRPRQPHQPRQPRRAWAGAGPGAGGAPHRTAPLRPQSSPTHGGERSVQRRLGLHVAGPITGPSAAGAGGSTARGRPPHTCAAPRPPLRHPRAQDERKPVQWTFLATRFSSFILVDSLLLLFPLCCGKRAHTLHSWSESIV